MSAITAIGDLEIEDPGCVHHIREHLANGCPLEPLVEAVAPMSAEERAPLVAAMVAKANHLIASRNEAANELLDTSNNSSDEPKRGRGRPKSPVREKLQEAAREAGVSERTIRRDAAKLAENTEPVSDELLKPPPSIRQRLSMAAVDLNAAVEKLAGVFTEMDALRPDYTDKDSRWAVLGAVKYALQSARAGASSVESAMTFMTRIDSSKYGRSARKTPVDSYDVKRGKERALASDEQGASETEAELASRARIDAETRDYNAAIEAGPGAVAALDKERAEKKAAEKQRAKEEKWARKQEERRARAEMVAEHGPAAYMSPLPPPKTGLGGKSLRVQMVDQQGNEMPYQEALDTADAAGVQGGAPEPFEEIEEEAF